MVFNYLATSFEGELLVSPPEGELIWIEKDKALELPMQDWFKRRFPLFFQAGTFEISFIWNERSQETLGQTIKHYETNEILSGGR